MHTLAAAGFIHEALDFRVGVVAYRCQYTVFCHEHFLPVMFEERLARIMHSPLKLLSKKNYSCLNLILKFQVTIIYAEIKKKI